MGAKLRIGLLQMKVRMNKEDNLVEAAQMIRQANDAGADIAVLPEMFCCPYDNCYFEPFAEPQGGKVWQFLSEAARKNSMYLVGGSMPESSNNKVYNTAYVFNTAGEQIAKHRKMHLFDVDVPGQRFFESQTLSAGNEVTVFDTVFGRFGLCICFDIRFFELSALMALEGATALIVPASFNMTTGQAHWELAFRQRAVDNQLFTVGVASARDVDFSYISYGNSIVVSPWGDVICRLDEKEQISVVKIDLNDVVNIREQLPILKNRRTDVYELIKKKRAEM